MHDGRPGDRVLSSDFLSPIAASLGDEPSIRFEMLMNSTTSGADEVACFYCWDVMAVVARPVAVKTICRSKCPKNNFDRTTSVERHKITLTKFGNLLISAWVM